MLRWRRAKAAAALVWQYAGKVTLWTPEMLLERQTAAAKSLIFEEGLIVPQGTGMVIWDYLSVLEQQLWPKEKRE
jgi:hypothetical protein